jgi:hypothetical protein
LRTTRSGRSRISVSVGLPSPRSSSSSAIACLPIAVRGWRIVVSDGDMKTACGTSSKPVTEKSRGNVVAAGVEADHHADRRLVVDAHEGGRQRVAHEELFDGVAAAFERAVAFEHDALVGADAGGIQAGVIALAAAAIGKPCSWNRR